MSDAKKTNFDSMIGRLVVEQGLATVAEVESCLQKQRSSMDDTDIKQKSLSDLLVDDGVVTQRQISRIKPEAEEQKRQTKQIPGFKIIKPLGAGAMAKVYLAKQLSLDRLVAIKVLPKKFTNNPKFVQRFYAEGKAAAKLNHPNIVGAYDVGQAGETHYFVMEYVEGKTVYDVIADVGQYKETDALEVICQVTLALQHAHASGIIHRDVKPKNIMIAADGNAKLADMGLARPLDDREAAEAEKGKAYGTPYYISPEQIRGSTDVDYRADIYSLGATFYHMVTGQVPFDGQNPSSVMHKHLKETLTPPDQINDNLTTGLCEIIEVCLAKDRDKRYNSTTDLLEDLNAVRRGEAPTQARNKFDFRSLQALEQTADLDVADAASQHTAITDQPLFWVAIAGWAITVVLIIVIVVLGG